MLIHQSMKQALLGDFNSCIFDSSIKVFCETSKFLSLVKEATMHCLDFDKQTS